MVELEEVGQLVRVLLVALQLLDQLQLPLDQRLAASRQVDEHAADAALQRRLVGRELEGLAVHGVEGPGDLADLVARVQRDGLDGDVRDRAQRMLSTAWGSRRWATSSADVRSTRSERVSERTISTMIVTASSRPSMRITELTPARLLARSSAASPAATSAVRTWDCAWVRTAADWATASSHAWGVTGIGPGAER